MAGKRIAILLSGGALLCLAACNRNADQNEPATGAPIAALQLATARPPPPSYAPPLAALPPASTPVRYRPRPERYRYLDDAYDMADAFGDTPPDYTVDYEGERPWIWRADDGAYRVVEWLPQGERYYYYEPGADAPFLIEDPDYVYAYDDGGLVAVYRPGGALVEDRLAAARAYDAARYYDRARALYRAAQNERRQAAYAANWRERAPVIRAQRERWERGQVEGRQWRDWTLAHQTKESRWESERQRRMAYAAALGAAGVGAAAAHHRAERTAIADNVPPAPQGQPTPPPAKPRAEPASPALTATAPDRENRRPQMEHALPMPARRSEPPPRAGEPRTHDQTVRSLPEEKTKAEPPRERSPDHPRPPSFARFASTQSQASPEPKTGLSARPDRPARPALVRPAPGAGPAGRPTPQADMRRTEPHPTAAPTPRASPPVERPAAPPPKVQTPRPQPPRVEAPHIEARRAEAPRAEARRAEAPDAQPPRATPSPRSAAIQPPRATPEPRPAMPPADRGGGKGKGKGHDKDRPH